MEDLKHSTSKLKQTDYEVKLFSPISFYVLSYFLIKVFRSFVRSYIFLYLCKGTIFHKEIFFFVSDCVRTDLQLLYNYTIRKTVKNSVYLCICIKMWPKHSIYIYGCDTFSFDRFPLFKIIKHPFIVGWFERNRYKGIFLVFKHIKGFNKNGFQNNEMHLIRHLLFMICSYGNMRDYF